MNKKIKDFSYALSANALNFIMGIVTGFLIPKFLGIEDYGYLKLFTFYTTYVGLMHLGFLDGIYVKYGSYDYEQLPKEKFRGYFRFLCVEQVVEAIVLSLLFFGINKDGPRGIVIIFVIINMVILNLTTLFAFVHQFTKRFKLFSINMILTKLLYVMGCLGLFAFSIYQYVPYIILQTVVNVVILIIYIAYNKEIVFGISDSLKGSIKEHMALIKMGSFVMIGNFMTIMILGIDRLFVDRLFSIKDFAMYSFAYSLVSLFYILLNSLTQVIYPYLTRTSTDKLKDVYEKIRILITIVMGSTLSAYFVIKIIVLKFLPEYIDCLNILLFLVPTIVLSAQISILVANYYKVLKETKDYTKNSIVALILGIATNIIGYVINKSVESIAIATLISFIIWVLYSDNYFKKKLNINVLKAQVLEIYVIVIFIISGYYFNWYMGLIIYLLLLVGFVLLKYRKECKNIVIFVKNE